MALVQTEQIGDCQHLVQLLSCLWKKEVYLLKVEGSELAVDDSALLGLAFKVNVWLVLIILLGTASSYQGCHKRIYTRLECESMTNQGKLLIPVMDFEERERETWRFQDWKTQVLSQTHDSNVIE